MNSLSELNSFGSTSVTITDNRSAGVKFDRVSPLEPLDQNAQRTQQSITVNPGINIVEIINFSTANVRYRIKAIKGTSNPLTISECVFNTMPSGVTLDITSTANGFIYTISGITKVSEWEAIKSFTWNVSSEFASKPLWFLDIAVVYFDASQGQDVDVSWYAYDPDNYYKAVLESTFTIRIPNFRVKRIAKNLSANFQMTTIEGRFKLASANLTSSFSLTASGLDLDLATANISTVSSLAVSATTVKRISQNISSVATISCVPTKYTGINNIDSGIGRYYYRNIGTEIFAVSQTPYIEDPVNANYTVLLSVSSSFGKFADSITSTTGSSNYSFSGTRDQVNAQFALITFFPVKNHSSNVTFTFTLLRNGNQTFTNNITAAYDGVGATLATTVYTNVTVQPTLGQQLYGLLDYLIVGGGGAGEAGNGTAGGGGGGGIVISAVDQPITSINYSVSVGAGGTVNSGAAGNSGSSSYISYDSTTITATGGEGGGVDGTGAGGDNATYNGANGNYVTANVQSAGGGAGAGGNGSSVVASPRSGGAGGAGVASSISGSSIIYGGGGGGGTVTTQFPIPFGANTGYGNPGAGGGGNANTYQVASLRPAEPGIAGTVIIKIHP
jgi:hypothetical protein